MTRALLALLAVFLLSGQSCDPPTEPEPPTPVNAFCHGTPLEEPGVLEKVGDFIVASYNAIVGGVVAEDRLATVYVRIKGTGGCSGAIIGPHTVITAGHCNGDQGYEVCMHATHGPCFQTDLATIHPGFYRWHNSREMPHDDLLVLHFPELMLPKPYVRTVYTPDSAAECSEVRAVGWGAWNREKAGAIPPEGYEYHVCPDEDGDGEPDSRCLLQAEYRVNDVVQEPCFEERCGKPPHPSQLDVEQVPWGGKCFGDSGSVLYAKVGDEWQMAGITSTVKSLDCVRGGTDVALSYYQPWLLDVSPP